MQEILPDIHRFSLGSKSRAHSYLLRRPQGNLLILNANQGSPVADFLDEIERLGGVAYQFVPNRHEVATRGGLHDRLFERFGCPLTFHERDRTRIARKTACPIVEFGDDGMQLGDDFRAIDVGSTVFHWSHRGAHHLFPGHAIGQHEQMWSIRLDPLLDRSSQLAGLRDLPVDRLLPGHTSPDDEDVYVFTDRSREAWREAIRAHLTPAGKSVDALLRLGERVERQALDPGTSHLFTNYVHTPLMGVVEQLGLFEMHRVPGGSSPKIDVLLNALEVADLFHFYDFHRAFAPTHAVWERLRRHVEEGGALLVSESRPRVNARWIAGGHPFPEIAVWGESAGEPQFATTDDAATGILTSCEGHPAIGSVPGEVAFESHLYGGGHLEPGEQGSVLVRNDSGRPVAVAGQVGKGRVVFSCFFFHRRQDPTHGPGRPLLQGMLRWLAGVESP